MDVFFLEELLDNEFAYTEEVYSEIGLVEDIKTFVKYNANKSLQNMGFDIYFKDASANDVNPIVMNGISIETANHDFLFTGWCRISNGRGRGNA